MKRKLLSLVLAMLMLMSILPIQAFAEEGETIAYAVEGGNIYFDKATGAITDADETVTSANIPAEIDGVAVTEIGKRAFYEQGNLESVSIPNSVTYIAERAFSYCNSLTELTIPGSVTEIDYNAFYYCSKLASLTLAQGVSSIGSYAFAYCLALTEVNLPGSVNTLGESVFMGCENIRAFQVDEANEHFSADSLGVLYDKEKTTLIRCPQAYSGNYDIAEGVKMIAYGAFENCANLTGVTFPESLKMICDSFDYCSALETVFIPAGVEYIVSGAFCYCNTLDGIWIDEANEYYSSDEFGVFFNKDQSILYRCCRTYAGEYVIPESVVEIAANAFTGCSELTAVTIPDGVKNISLFAFYNCTGLTEVQIPQSVKMIQDSAFFACDNLARVSIPDVAMSIGQGAFLSTALMQEESNWENGVLYIDNHLIVAKTSLEGTYEVREGTVTIADVAFYGCSNMTDVTIPEGVMQIGLNAFKDSGYYNDEAKWSDNVLYNGNYLLKAKESIDGAYEIRSNTILIADFAFSGCTQLTSVSIPESVKRIGEFAFRDCDNLQSVTIPQSVTEISKGTFYSCNALLSVTIPDTVRSIEDSAFEFCNDLSNVYYGGLKTQWDAIQIGAENGYLTNAVIHFSDGTTSLDFVNEPSEEPSEPSEEPSEPSEEPSEPSEEPSAPSEEPSAPSEEPSEPSEEPSEPSEAPSEPSEPTDKPDAPEIPKENPFTDVKESDYFATPVLWAVGKNITNGMSATSFAPNANCTRGQIVTFLWRACGSPEPTKKDNPFTDVKADAYYYKAVLWAVEKGITTGLSATTFGPNATCTRGQVATFLWRSQGEPAPKSTNNPFSDVKTNDYYFKAVLWAVENDVTQGMGGGKFAPNASCTRGQIVTFLYRAIA